MLFRPFFHPAGSPVPRPPAPGRRPILWARLLVTLAVGGGVRSLAGTTVALPPPPLASHKDKTPTRPDTTPARPVEFRALPYLLAVGPRGIAVQPVPGPRVRQPPLLPPPKIVRLEADAGPTTPPPLEPLPRKPAEPSAFSPEAPPVLLPSEQPAATPAPAKPAAPTESVLTPGLREEQELRDSVIYFETPVGAGGGQVTVPAVVPLTSPAPGAPPASRATYRKEKP